MGAARIIVAVELLRDSLHLPHSTEILLARTDRYGEVELTVVDPDIRDVVLAEGELPPVLNPSFRKQEPIVFEGWNQK